MSMTQTIDRGEVGDTQESCGLARSLAVRADRAGVEMRVFTNHLNAVVWLDAKDAARVPVPALWVGEHAQ